MSDDLVDMINANAGAVVMRIGTVTEIVDASHVKVNLGDKVRTVFCAGGTAVVGQQVQVALDGNVATLAAGGVPIASVIDYFGTAAPAGYLFADGSTFSATDYPALAAALGATTLPDCRERVGVGYKSGSTFAGTLKGTGGSADAVVVEHRHGYFNHDNQTAPPRGTGADWTVAAIADTNKYTDYAGESGTNKNLQPFYVCNKIIRAI